MGKNKFINPVEKARKKAKRNEAKKQKKQREDARSFTLKSKNPNQIILELERLDQIEFNVEEPPKLSEKVIATKRRKLKETWFKMLAAFRRDDKHRYTELKRLEMEYEANRIRLVKKFEAIKSAKEVDLEQIPLPMNTDDNLLNDKNEQTASNKINLKPQKFITINGEIKELKPPGCPALVPPSLDELEDELKISRDTNADLDEFLKEVDQVEKMLTLSKETKQNVINDKEPTVIPKAPINLPPTPKQIITSLPNATINPAPYPILLNPNAINPMGLINPHNIKKPGLLNALRPPSIPLNKQFPNQPNKNLLNKKVETKLEPEKQTVATIEAKPQLRNLSADLTKFIPASLRIKRDNPTMNKKVIKPNQGFQPRQISNTTTFKPNKPADNQANKDAAYEEFMKELNGLI